jgi:hypothetical protein
MSTTVVTRELIEKQISRLNEIENDRSTQSANETVARLSELFAENIEGWVNGKHISGRSAVDELDRALYELVDDYHRDINHLIVDPPFVSFDWCMKSAKHKLDAQGCSIIESDEAGLHLRSWMYFDPEPFVRIGLF